jgi:hypothetical protein
MDGERVNATGELGCQRLVNHAVTLDAGLSFERFRHNINAVMRLPARPVSGMTFVLVGFILHLEALRSESLGQLLCDDIGGSHVVRLGEGGPAVNGRDIFCGNLIKP